MNRFSRCGFRGTHTIENLWAKQTTQLDFTCPKHQRCVKKHGGDSYAQVSLLDLVWFGGFIRFKKKHQLSGVVPPSILLSKMTKINSMLGGNLVKTWAIDYYLMDHKLNKFWQYKIRPLLYKLFESLTNQTRGLRHNLLILNFWYLKTKIQNISLSCLMTFIYKLSFPAAKV